MESMKKYRNLTINYSLLIIVLSVMFSFSVQAEIVTPAPATTETVQRVITEKSESEVAREKEKERITACNTNISALDSKMSGLTKACADTRLGGTCLKDLLECHKGTGSSETCEKIDAISSGPTRDELDNEIEQLNKKKDALDKKKDELVEKEDTIKSAIEDIGEEKKDLIAQKEDSQAELKAKLEEGQSAASQKAAQLQEAVETLQDEVRNLYDQRVADSVAIPNLIAQERLRCNAEAAQKSAEFIQYFRGCQVNGGCKSVNQASLLGAGKRSLNDMGTNYAQKHIRKCMSTTNTNLPDSFAVKYQNAQMNLKVKDQLLASKRSALEGKQIKLKAQIAMVAAERSQQQANELLSKSNRDLGLAAKETDASMRQLTKSMELAKLAEEKEKLTKEISEVEDKIRSKEKEKAKALTDDKLSSFKSAMADIDTMLSTAKDIKSCGCTGSVKTLDKFFGDVCESSSSAPVTEQPSQVIITPAATTE